MFSYLHVIVVKRNCRSKGIGRILINYFENALCEGYEKVFLMVGDFNFRAKKLYKKLGYEEVSIIPDFYQKGITEHLMMKSKD